MPETSTSRGRIKGKFSEDPSNSASGVKISANSFFTAWRNNTDVFGCVREIYETVGLGGHYFYDPKDEKGEEPAPPALEKQIMDIFEHQYSGGLVAFQEDIFKQFLITGNAFVEKVMNATDTEMLGVKVLDSRTFQIVTDEFGNVYKYIQSTPYENIATSDPVLFEPEDIIHWKNGKDPNSEAFGFSPMEPVLWEVRADVSAMVQNYFFFENQAVPAVQYILEDELSDEEIDQAIKLIERQFKGAKNKGKSGVLKGIKEIKQVSLSQKDMEYLNLRKFTTEKVSTAYGVPKAILGYTEGMTFNNLEQQMKKFYESTVKKYEMLFQRLINKDIIEDSLGLEDQIMFGFNPASFDTEETLWQRAMQARDRGIVTTNGARSMVGLDPIEEDIHGDLGDRIIQGTGISAVPLTDIGTDPAADPTQLEKLVDKVKQLDELNQPANVQ